MKKNLLFLLFAPSFVLRLVLSRKCKIIVAIEVPILRTAVLALLKRIPDLFVGDSPSSKDISDYFIEYRQSAVSLSEIVTTEDMIKVTKFLLTVRNRAVLIALVRSLDILIQVNQKILELHQAKTSNNKALAKMVEGFKTNDTLSSIKVTGILTSGEIEAELQELVDVFEKGTTKEVGETVYDLTNG